MSPRPAVGGAVLTERPAAALRRWWLWAAAGGLVLVVAVVSVLIGSGRAPGTPLSPENPAPAGAKALAAVLRQQGVEVVVPSTLADAVAQAAAPGTTLLLDDPGRLIGPTGAAAIREAVADRLVLLEPAADALPDFGAPVTLDAFVAEADGEAVADCDLPAVQRAGRIVGDAWTYRSDDPAATACWRSPDGGARLIDLPQDGHELVVLGTTTGLSNDRIVQAGDAAFALGLLGATPRLVWFQPTERAGWSDDATGAAPSIGSVSPDWVVPVMLLLAAVTVAAGIWRGRRFGRLVVEPLPAVVPADETIRGRARLYAAARARLRAADALRIGTIGRLAAALGLPASAGVDEVATATAAITGRPVAAVLALLRDHEPAGDRDLVALSDELLRLETDLNGRMKP